MVGSSGGIPSGGGCVFAGMAGPSGGGRVDASGCIAGPSGGGCGGAMDPGEGGLGVASGGLGAGLCAKGAASGGAERVGDMMSVLALIGGAALLMGGIAFLTGGIGGRAVDASSALADARPLGEGIGPGPEPIMVARTGGAAERKAGGSGTLGGLESGGAEPKMALA
jgi:hypothetical protein